MTKLRIFTTTFILFQYISAGKKPRWMTMLLLRYVCFKNLKIWLAESTFTHAQVKIYKHLLRFLNLYQHGHSWFKNYAIWLEKNIFDHTQRKIFKLPFTLLQSITACLKSPWLRPLLLRYSWFKNPEIWLAESNFDHIQLKIYKTSFMFLASISLCQKLSWFIIFFLRYSWFKNPASHWLRAF